MHENMGNDGFIWFKGIIEDVAGDPLELGRVRVRCFNLHSQDKTQVQTAHLPWASLSQNVTSAAHQKIGTSPTGIAVGTLVWGFFIDGDQYQQPIICGTIAGIPGGVSDLSPLVTGTNTINKGNAEFEPASPYKATYPYNKVTTTSSGHVIEIDDTPGAERVHIYHKSGTYDEIGPDGTKVVKVVGHDITVCLQEKAVTIQGDYTLYTKGDANISVDGTANITSKTKIALTAPSVSINGA